ncbi:hypothetical protein OSTOST_06233 [Ostertagia ostertagi]
MLLVSSKAFTVDEFPPSPSLTPIERRSVLSPKNNELIAEAIVWKRAQSENKSKNTFPFRSVNVNYAQHLCYDFGDADDEQRSEQQRSLTAIPAGGGVGVSQNARTPEPHCATVAVEVIVKYPVICASSTIV